MHLQFHKTLFFPMEKCLSMSQKVLGLCLCEGMTEGLSLERYWLGSWVNGKIKHKFFGIP